MRRAPNSKDRWPYTRRRPDRTVDIDLRPFLLEANLEDRGAFRPGCDRVGMIGAGEVHVARHELPAALPDLAFVNEEP